MTQETVNFLIPFKTLVEAISRLSLEDKRLLWKLLDEQMAEIEVQTKEPPSTTQTEIQEARIAYQTKEDIVKENTIQIEIMEELKKLTTTERLTIIEAVLNLIREDLRQTKQSLAWTEKTRQLTKAAEALLPDYTVGGDLTAFTALAGENFYA
jgi:hypothetical protein